MKSIKAVEEAKQFGIEIARFNISKQAIDGYFINSSTDTADKIISTANKSHFLYQRCLAYLQKYTRILKELESESLPPNIQVKLQMQSENLYSEFLDQVLGYYLTKIIDEVYI